MPTKSGPDNSCPFCRIIEGKAPPPKGWMRDEGPNEDWVAFAPLNPVVEGHYLVVPTEHAETLMTLNPWVLYTTMDGIREIAEKLMATGRWDSFNLIQSNGAAATQTVPHVHFHIVPRRESDGLKLPWSEQQVRLVRAAGQL